MIPEVPGKNNTMKRAYYYLFYKIYRFWYNISGDAWSDFKALLSIGVLQAFTFLSLYIWWAISTKSILSFSKYWIVTIAVSIGFINYYIFFNKNIWMKYNKEFDTLPKQKNKLGGWLVFGLVVIIISGLIFSFYALSQIDWSQYR